MRTSTILVLLALVVAVEMERHVRKTRDDDGRNLKRRGVTVAANLTIEDVDDSDLRTRPIRPDEKPIGKRNERILKQRYYHLPQDRDGKILKRRGFDVAENRTREDVDESDLTPRPIRPDEKPIGKREGRILKRRGFHVTENQTREDTDEFDWTQRPVDPNENLLDASKRRDIHPHDQLIAKRDGRILKRRGFDVAENRTREDVDDSDLGTRPIRPDEKPIGKRNGRILKRRGYNLPENRNAQKGDN